MTDFERRINAKRLALMKNMSGTQPEYTTQMKAKLYFTHAPQVSIKPLAMLFLLVTVLKVATLVTIKTMVD